VDGRRSGKGKANREVIIAAATFAADGGAFEILRNCLRPAVRGTIPGLHVKPEVQHHALDIIQKSVSLTNDACESSQEQCVGKRKFYHLVIFHSSAS
jgi:hypothetical protein